MNDDQIKKNWTLIDKSDGLSKIVTENLIVKKIEIPINIFYDYKIITEDKKYYVNIIKVDEEHKFIYANVKECN